MKHSVNHKKKKGFTLVELIVVMAIIAILAGVTVPTTLSILNEAKDSNRNSALSEYGKIAYQLYISGDLDQAPTTSDIVTRIIVDNPSLFETYSSIPVYKPGIYKINGNDDDNENFFGEVNDEAVLAIALQEGQITSEQLTNIKSKFMSTECITLYIGEATHNGVTGTYVIARLYVNGKYNDMEKIIKVNFDY